MPSCSSLIRHHWAFQTMEVFQTANTRRSQATDQVNHPPCCLQTRMVPSRPAVKIVPRRRQNTDSPKKSPVVLIRRKGTGPPLTPFSPPRCGSLDHTSWPRSAASLPFRRHFRYCGCPYHWTWIDNGIFGDRKMFHFYVLCELVKYQKPETIHHCRASEDSAWRLKAPFPRQRRPDKPCKVVQFVSWCFQYHCKISIQATIHLPNFQSPIHALLHMQIWVQAQGL